MRFLLFGGSGQVGTELRALTATQGIDIVAPARSEINLEDPASIAKIVAAGPWSAVINAAAYTNVDRAESEEETAFVTNCKAAGWLAAETANHGIPLLHISTDYVFDGRKGSPYVEDDVASPLNAYGRSKLAGEQAVKSANPRHIILRTAWVFSPYGKNFVKTIMRLAQERDRLTIVADQRGCPTAARDVARITLDIALHCAAEPQRVPYGTYHFAGAGEATWFEFATAIVELTAPRIHRSPKVEPISTTDYPTPALRPADTRLNCAAIVTAVWCLPAALAKRLSRDDRIADSECRMKGIILAGGSGTRLYPATLVINKQLLPIYDKPMVYYPLSVLMLAGIRDILLISTPQHLSFYQHLLGNGADWGIQIDYVVQDKPIGLAHAFILGREFVSRDRVALILGDNLYYGQGLRAELAAAAARPEGATIFAYHVSEPSQYGVVKFDNADQPVDIVEKPRQFLSNWAVTGLYFYDNTVLDIAANLRPSARGELEITDVNRRFLELKKLNVVKLGRGYAWLDTGNPDALLEAAEFVRSVQHRQGLLIGCPEEAAYQQGFITADMLGRLAGKYNSSAYGRYLRRLVEDER